jgi:hypothetical protein
MVLMSDREHPMLSALESLHQVSFTRMHDQRSFIRFRYRRTNSVCLTTLIGSLSLQMKKISRERLTQELYFTVKSHFTRRQIDVNEGKPLTIAANFVSNKVFTTVRMLRALPE